MNKISRHLGPATRGTAIFRGGTHHVNTFRHRAAFRCIHSGPNGVTGGPPNGNEASASNPGAKTDGLEGEGPPGSKAHESRQSIDHQEQSGPIQQVGQSISSHREESSDLKPESHQSVDKIRLPGGEETAKSATQPSEPPFPLRRAVHGYDKRTRSSFSGLSKSSPREAAVAAWQTRKESQKGSALNRDIFQRSSTIEYDFPEQATKENLLASLQKIRFTSTQWNKWAKNAGPQAVIILFTPGLAAFVENDATLVPDMLKRMTRMSEWRDEKPLEIEVICACVDGLAPGPESLSVARGRRPKEGFSFLHSLRSATLPPFLADSEASLSTSPSMQSSITLRKAPQGPPDLTLPLANTLFKTGRLSTLLASRWQYNAGEDAFIAIQGPVERTNVVIDMFQGLSTRLPRSLIPAIPLTPARPIVNGLGNIVRTIDFGGEEGSGPASRELESAVTRYLEAMKYGNTTIDVWALVIPPESVPKGAKLGLPPANPNRNSLPVTANEIESKWQAPVEQSERLDYVGHWIKTANAKFCRVLSGGGGWGAKQGLLSLDPQTTYSEVPEARFDFSGGSLEDQQTSALGNIAQEGAFIQFFVARRQRSIVPVRRQGTYKYLMKRSAVFGAVPSTVDDIPPPQRAANEDASTGTESIHIRRGHFGFVSESGMFIRHGPAHKPDRSPTADKFTKVDMPYSYFYLDHIVPSKQSEEKPSVIRHVNTTIREGVIRKVPTDRNFSGAVI
ncbi:hypothetical protein BKA65DRAFT_489714 [Rhexocercosporidium sp. MPI-PUGE-AT-0058]|nr:hypothetical protein BKA65DRAFT_489714 [Rhexocercosporidium sp. MPI-PUGE-AT-0058]